MPSQVDLIAVCMCHGTGLRHDQSPTVLLQFLRVFGDTLNGVDMYANMEHPRFWIGPLISVLVGVFLIIVLLNLLIAVMVCVAHPACRVWTFIVVTQAVWVVLTCRRAKRTKSSRTRPMLCGRSLSFSFYDSMQWMLPPRSHPLLKATWS